MRCQRSDCEFESRHPLSSVTHLVECHFVKMEVVGSIPAAGVVEHDNWDNYFYPKQGEMNKTANTYCKGDTICV